MTQAICKSRENTTVIKFSELSEFNSEIQRMHENGELWGVYETKDGTVAEDIWGDIHENIFEND